MTTQIYGPDRPLRIGTRGSPLALAQAAEVRARLMTAHSLPEEAFHIEVIRTTGDKVQDRPLGEIGGKGLFTKEIEEAMLDHRVDIAVHSMKDAPTYRQPGLALTTYLEREDPRDAFVSHEFTSFDELPQGALVGSSSLRRRAQALARRPDLRMVEFRGNVQTRMRKLEGGVAAATFLACAGLNRLDFDGGELASGGATPVPEDVMLPAVAQGAIGIEARADEDDLVAFLSPLDHAETRTRLEAERAFLETLDGSCRTPLAALAELDGDRLTLRAEILRPDGALRHATMREGPASDAAAMGRDAGAELRETGGPGFFDA